MSRRSLTLQGGVIWIWFRPIPLPLDDLCSPSIVHIFWEPSIEESQLLSMDLRLGECTQILLLEQRTYGSMSKHTS